MPMSGSHLSNALKADILTQLQAKFPIPSDLQAAEKTALQTAQQNLADAIALGSGPDIVTEVQSGTVSTVDTGVVTSGAGAGGAVTGTGTGSIS
jgi:hypothetical protein